MDYYGLLFLYYLKGLSGKSILRLFFNIEAGGTEQLLPENTSTPTTTPILADIQYPDGLRTDQYFTYRETPTTISNKARIKTIKGNTSVWNQNCYSFSALRSTLSSSINSQTDITCTASSGQTSFGIIIQDDTGYFNFIGGHTYLLSMNISEITVNNFSRISPESTMNPQNLARETGRYTTICTPTASGPKSILCYLSGTTTTSDKFKFNSVQIVDLTILNDSRITDYDSFRTYYPLSFYPYNSGSLLSFNGNGIKTVGKNLLETATSGSVSGVTFTVNSDGSITVNGTATSNGTYDLYRNTTVLPSWARAGETYVLSLTNIINRFDIFSYDSSGTSKSLASISGLASQTFTIPNDAVGLLVRIFVTSGVAYDVTVYPQIEFGTTPSSYEPYTSSTLSLPISTYFPTGMKSVGTVYDELTPTKAITRIGAVDLGSVTWIYNSTDQRFYANIEGVKASPTSGTAFSSGMLTVPYQTVFTDTPVSFGDMLAYIADKDMLIWQYTTGGGVANINIKDTRYTDATTFKSAMSGVYLYYELATPTETPITTEDANEALSLLMGKSVSSNDAKQMIDIITKGE